MLMKLLVIFLTFVVLALIGNISVLIGSIICIILTFLYIFLCFAEDEAINDTDETETRKLYIIYFWIRKTLCLSRCKLYSTAWLILYVSLRRIYYVVRLIYNSYSNRNQHSSSNDTVEQSQALICCDASSSVNSEVKTIVDCIIEHYIKSWYNDKVSESNTFTCDIDLILQDTLTAFCTAISKIDREQFLYHILQLYLHYFVHFKEAIREISQRNNVLEACYAKRKEIVENFKMQHWALKDATSEWCYVQTIMSSLIDAFGPVELLSSPALHSLIVEILAQNIMFPLINILSDSDRLNTWLAKLLLNLLSIETELAVRKVEIESSSFNTSSNDLEDENTKSTQDNSTPCILLPQDTAQNSDDAYVNVSNSLLLDNMSDVMSSTFKFSEASEKYTDALSETFEDNKSDTQQELSDIIFQDDDEMYPYSFPPMNVKAHSNENLTANNCNTLTPHTNNEDTLITSISRNMKRSKSADYIRQMPNLNLLPINLSNSSIRLRERNNKTFIHMKSDVTSSDSSVEVAEEAIEHELPPLFTDMQIVGTQQQDDPGHVPYTLYCIQYCGLFQDITKDSEMPLLVRQAVNIKRRFREFLTLQSRLESNSGLKGCLKDIKCLSKWHTPFSNLDKKNISERKVVLEYFLQELCKHDAIAKSKEFQEFLAYGGDASIAFVKQNMDSGIPRLDKIIVKSMKGAFELFRSAVPNLPETGSLREISYEFDQSEEESCSDLKFQVYLTDFTKRNSSLVDEMESYLKHFDEDSSTGSFCNGPVTVAHKGNSKRLALLRRIHSTRELPKCDCSKTISINDILQAENIEHVALDILMELLYREKSPEPSCSMKVFRFMASSFLTSFTTVKLSELSEAQCAFLLHLFHKSLWNKDKNIQEQTKRNLEAAKTVYEAIKQYYEDVAKEQHTGMLLNHVLGPNDVSNAIQLLLGSFQIKELNKCFLFHAFDIIMKNLC